MQGCITNSSPGPATMPLLQAEPDDKLRGMSAFSDTHRDLQAVLAGHMPLILIETRDERRVLELIASLAPRLATAHTPVFQWTVTDGLRRLDIDLGGAQQHNAEPTAVLRTIRSIDKAGVYVLLDFHPFLGDPVHVRLLKDICQNHARTR